MQIIRSTRRFTAPLITAACLAAGVLNAALRADTNVEFIDPDDNSRAHGVIGYVVADDGNGEVTTYILADSDAVVTSSRPDGCVVLEAAAGDDALMLRFTTDRVAQFVRGDGVVAEISPSASGVGWNHWGTENLPRDDAYEAMTIVTGDSNLQLLGNGTAPTQDCTPSKGYWDCVLMVLKCEEFSAACVLAGVTQNAPCSEECQDPMSPECAACLEGLEDTSQPNGILIDPCSLAKKCWQAASEAGCVPW